MILTIALCLVAILTIPLLAFALIFAVGTACGVAAYHLSRTVVVQYQPMRKAVDQEKERNKAIAKANQLGREANDIALGHLSGLTLDRDSFLRNEGLR